jgi:hypothetical protein
MEITTDQSAASQDTSRLPAYKEPRSSLKGNEGWPMSKSADIFFDTRHTPSTKLAELNQPQLPKPDHQYPKCDRITMRPESLRFLIRNQSQKVSKLVAGHRDLSQIIA